MFSDVLPAGLTYISATSTLGSAPTYSAATGTVTAVLGNLPAGSTAKLTILVVPSGGLTTGGAATTGHEHGHHLEHVDRHQHLEQLGQRHVDRHTLGRPGALARRLTQHRAGRPEPDLHDHRGQ